MKANAIKCTIVAIGLAAILASVQTQAGEAPDSIQHSAAASAHSVSAVISGLIAAGQVTSAVSAMPLALSASAGVVSGQAAKSLLEAARAPIGTPLPISDETCSAGPPPDEALKPNQTVKPNKPTI